MTEIYVSLAVLAVVFLIIYVMTVYKTRTWQQGNKKPALTGLALPEGSVRAMIAFLVVMSFIIFVFFGKAALIGKTGEKMEYDDAGNVTECTTTEDSSLFTAILTAFGTLTGSVTGFYFAERKTGQNGAQAGNEQ